MNRRYAKEDIGASTILSFRDDVKRLTSRYSAPVKPMGHRSKTLVKCHVSYNEVKANPFRTGLTGGQCQEANG